MNEVEISHGGINIVGVVFSYYGCRAVDRVGWQKARGKFCTSGTSGLQTLGLTCQSCKRSRGPGQCALDDVDSPGVVVVARHFVVAQMLLHPEPSSLPRVI